MATKGIKLGSLFVEIGSDISGYKEGSKKVRGDLKNISGSAKMAGAAITAMGAATVAAMGIATAKASSFNTALAEINTLGVENLGAIKEAVLDVATTYGGDLVTNAKAAYQAISAGASEAQVPHLLAEAAKAATAGVSDLTTAIELGTSVSNAYGKSLDDVNKVYDEAFIAVKNGVTTFGELAASMADVTAVAAPLNVTSAEAFAAVSALTKAGNSTSKSVTRMAAALNAMLRPSAQAKKVAAALGIEFDAQAIKAKGLAGFLDELKDSLSDKNLTKPKIIEALKEIGVNAKDVEGILGELFGSQEAIGAMLTLTGSQAEEFARTLEEMGAATGATDAALQSFLDANPGQQFEQMKATLSALAVEMGEHLLPLVVEFARWITDSAKAVIEFSKTHPGAAKGLTMIAAALGTLATAAGAVIGIMGTLGISLIGMPAAAGAVSAAAGGLVAALTGPAGVVVVAGAAIAAINGIVIATGLLVEAKKTQHETDKQTREMFAKEIDLWAEKGLILDAEILKLQTLEEQERALMAARQESREQERAALGLNDGSVDEAQDVADAIAKHREYKDVLLGRDRAVAEAITLTNRHAEAFATQSQAIEFVGQATEQAATAEAGKNQESEKAINLTDDLVRAFSAEGDAIRAQSQQYIELASAAREAAAAKRAAASAGSGGESAGGGGEFANGGIVKGYALGGVIDSMFQVIGERGAEFANLPAGTRIHTHAESRQMITDGIARAMGGVGRSQLTMRFGDVVGGILDPEQFMQGALRQFEQMLGERLSIERALRGA